MKATGIVRRVDDLGRVVIPKELRRTMKLREGDPVEFFIDTEQGGLVMKKYFPYQEDEIDEIINKLFDMNISPPKELLEMKDRFDE